MKNPAEVLRHKEIQLQELQREIDALRIAVRLCSEDGEAANSETVRMDASVISTPRPPRSVSAEPEKAVKQFP